MPLADGRPDFRLRRSGVQPSDVGLLCVAFDSSANKHPGPAITSRSFTPLYGTRRANT